MRCLWAHSRIVELVLMLLLRNYFKFKGMYTDISWRSFFFFFLQKSNSKKDWMLCTVHVKTTCNDWQISKNNVFFTIKHRKHVKWLKVRHFIILWKLCWIWGQQHISKPLGHVYHCLASRLLLTTVCKWDQLDPWEKNVVLMRDSGSWTERW